MLENCLFVLGVSAGKGSTFFRQAYFYYLMVVVAVCEKVLLSYVEFEREEKKMEA